MVSFWEKESLLETDIAVIGGGITGLSVAASLRERWRKKDITVFERSILPYGASTRNAGFACFGSFTEVLADAKTMGWDATAQLVEKRFKGIRKTRSRFRDDLIGYNPYGGWEALNAAQLPLLGQLDEANRYLQTVFKTEYFRIQDKLVSEWKLNAEKCASLVSMEYEGQVHTGKLMKQLERFVLEKGISVRTGAKCLEILPDEGFIRLVFEDPARGKTEFRSGQVVVCTNAFAPQVLPGLKVTPGRGQVFITGPIPSIRFYGNLHMDEGFYYLRNVGERLLFGGGRNLDFEGEETTEMALSEILQRHLEKTLDDLFRPAVDFTIDQRWSGIMAFGNDKQPVVKEVSPGVFCAVKMSGMGVALSAEIGEEVARLVHA